VQLHEQSDKLIIIFLVKCSSCAKQSGVMGPYLNEHNWNMYYVQLRQQSNHRIILVISNCSNCVNNLINEILTIASIIIPKRTTTDLRDCNPIQLQVNSTATEIERPNSAPKLPSKTRTTKTQITSTIQLHQQDHNFGDITLKP